jgi:hypothetical protein
MDDGNNNHQWLNGLILAAGDDAELMEQLLQRPSFLEFLCEMAKRADAVTEVAIAAQEVMTGSVSKWVQ